MLLAEVLLEKEAAMESGGGGLLSVMTPLLVSRIAGRVEEEKFVGTIMGVLKTLLPSRVWKHCPRYNTSGAGGRESF